MVMIIFVIDKGWKSVPYLENNAHFTRPRRGQVIVCLIFPVRHTLNTLPNLKLTHLWIHPPEIPHFYGNVLKTLDKPINLNTNVLDQWLFIYCLLYIGMC